MKQISESYACTVTSLHSIISSLVIVYVHCSGCGRYNEDFHEACTCIFAQTECKVAYKLETASME